MDENLISLGRLIGFLAGLLTSPFLVGLVGRVFGDWYDSIKQRLKNWNHITFSVWDPPIGSDVIGGIKIHNGKSIDLTNCEADFIRYDDDQSFDLRAKSLSKLLESNDGLPCRLRWYDKHDKKYTTDIGRGKDGYVSLDMPFLWEIKKGWIFVRISGYENTAPLPVAQIAARIEVENEKPIIKEIVKKGKRK